jgi:hypothetical protein
MKAERVVLGGSRIRHYKLVLCSTPAYHLPLA